MEASAGAMTVTRPCEDIGENGVGICLMEPIRFAQEGEVDCW